MPQDKKWIDKEINKCDLHAERIEALLGNISVDDVESDASDEDLEDLRETLQYSLSLVMSHKQNLGHVKRSLIKSKANK